MAEKTTYSFKSNVWLYPGMAGWHFLTIPKKESKEITTRFEKWKRGWGSLCVDAAIGKTKWQSSIFPDAQSGTYLLPLAKKIRKAEDIMADDKVSFTIKIKKGVQ